MSQEIGDNVKKFILLISRSAGNMPLACFHVAFSSLSGATPFLHTRYSSTPFPHSTNAWNRLQSRERTPSRIEKSIPSGVLYSPPKSVEC